MLPQPPSKVVYIVVGGQVLLAVVCVTCLCLTLFFRNYSDPVVVTALIGITSVLIGNLGSILGGPMRQMMSGKVEIEQPPDKPVPVQETAHEE